MMRRSHGPLQLVMRSGLLLLLLLLNGVLAQVQDDKEQQGLQDFHSNFGGPPLGENGFVGENPLPRPQGILDLGNFGDHLFSRDIFQEVDQTFNSNNQLTHVTANTTLKSASATTTPLPIPATASSPLYSLRGTAGPRRPRAPFHPRLPLQQHEPFHSSLPRSPNSIRTETSKQLLSSSSSIVTENSINLSLESGTFQPSIPRAELSNDISSFSTSSSDLRVSSVADTDDFHESSAFQVFHDRVPGTESSSDPGPVSTVPEDVLTINFEENQQPFQGFRGNQRPGRPGRGPNRPPSSRHPGSRPLRRPIRQPGFNGRPGGQPGFNGRPGGQPGFNGRPGGPNRQRTGEPSFISLLIG